MSGRDARSVGDLEVEIDRDLCVGFGDCIDESPAAFELDDEGIAVFRDPDGAEREELLRACDACPVDAITVRNGDGEQLVP